MSRDYFTPAGGRKRKARVRIHSGLLVSVKPIGLAVSDLRGFPPPRLARLACHARRRLRSSCRSARIHGLPAMRLRQTRRHRRLEPACRQSQVFAFSNKGELVLVAVPIDAYQVAKMDLLCSP